jgi:hypothetical protein
LRHEEEARLRRWYYIMDPFYKERILISDADEHQKLLWRSIHYFISFSIIKAQIKRQQSAAYLWNNTIDYTVIDRFSTTSCYIQTVFPHVRLVLPSFYIFRMVVGGKS